jgi:translocator protein
MNKILKIILCIMIPLGIGGISGFFTASNIPTWYATLNKPWFSPPNYLFGPVWTSLYIMMGIALYLIIESNANEPLKRKAYMYWGIQMILNFLWSIIFMHFHQIGLALIEIIAMWVMILMTILTFSKINKTAAYLLVPYISWVSFATILNFSIFMLNR